METGTNSKEEWKKKFVARLERLIRSNAPSRRERFIPFLLVLTGKTEDPRYEESLETARYFLENALLFTEEDEAFYRVLRDSLPPEELKKPTPWGRSLQDYLKIIYDLRTMEEAG